MAEGPKAKSSECSCVKISRTSKDVVSDSCFIMAAMTTATPKLDKKKFNELITQAQQLEKKGNIKQALEIYLDAQCMKADHDKLNKKIKMLVVRLALWKFPPSDSPLLFLGQN